MEPTAVTAQRGRSWEGGRKCQLRGTVPTWSRGPRGAHKGWLVAVPAPDADVIGIAKLGLSYHPFFTRL